MIEEGIDDYCLSGKPEREYQRQRRSFGQNLVQWVDSVPGEPVDCLAACYVHMGRLDEARDVVKRLRTITPQVMPNDMAFRNPEDRELFLSGLRLAAGEVE
jgi:hypothetical protein